MRPGRGFKRCTTSVHREYEGAARAILAKHPSVVAETIRFSGEHLSWSLDLSLLPEGDGPAIELVLVRDIERAAKP